MTRNQFLATLAGSFAISKAQANFLADEFSLPALGFAYNALEPHIDAATMEIHYSKHHQAYVNNLNKALQEAKISGLKIEEIVSNVSKYSTAVRNNGGGHWNHSFFWRLLTPASGSIGPKTLELINRDLGGVEKMKLDFAAAATSRFGSGWAWIIVQNDKLKICSTPNQDNPLMDIADQKGKPILALDVWEHAYYLKYQNKRADYIKAFWNIVNWQEVENNLKK